MRAILLAAGTGTRLKPLTDTTPKPLIKVNGLSLIERQIQLLKEKGINEIIIITGYLKEKFNYLVYKYNVKLIYNDNYDKYNNLYSMYLARDFLEDSYILEGDIYIHNNIFTTDITKSTYFSPIKYDFNNEWILKTDNNSNVKDIIIGSTPGSYIMCGVSYWNKKDGKFIQEKLKTAILNDDFKNKYWDHIIKENIHNLNIKINPLLETDLYEIDSLNDLEKVRMYCETMK